MKFLSENFYLMGAFANALSLSIEMTVWKTCSVSSCRGGIRPQVAQGVLGACALHTNSTEIKKIKFLILE